MRKLLLVIGVMLMGGCTQSFDFTGVTELETFADQLVNTTQVADVACTVATLSLAELTTGQCFAFNANGTMLTYLSNPLVVWSSTSPNTVKITLDGFISTNGATGTSYIKATGTYNTVDSVLVTVVQ